MVPADPETGVEDSSGAATGGWLLRTSVDVTDGVMFEVMGTTTAGGDSDKVWRLLVVMVDYAAWEMVLRFFVLHERCW